MFIFNSFYYRLPGVDHNVIVSNVNFEISRLACENDPNFCIETVGHFFTSLCYFYSAVHFLHISGFLVYFVYHTL